METKHTPGPWSIALGDGCFIVETDDSTVRFVVMGLNMEGDRSNAQLIAAAPDLLAAANAAIVLLRTHGLDAGQVGASLEIAISKATGA